MRRWFLILWSLVILGATLIPLEPSEEVSPIFCVLCGYGAAADGILNAALFLPLGAALNAASWRPLWALALGTLLSLGVETAQFVIPGRDPSLADVLFNTLGTALGIALARSAFVWWRPVRRAADAFSIGGSLGATVVLALTGILLAPSFPEDVYYGSWTPRFGHLEWYGGRVLEASLDGLAIPTGPIIDSAGVRQRLLAETLIRVLGRAGPRSSGLAPLFTVHYAQGEILLLGIDGDDFIYRYRTRAITWGLIGPEIRVRKALRGIAWRNPLSVIVRKAGSGFCVRINAVERCGLGYTIGIGWKLLLGNQPVPLELHPMLNVVWLAVLFFASGRWAQSRLAFATAATLGGGGLLVLPIFTGLLATPASELLGALAGFLMGWASRARFGL